MKAKRLCLFLVLLSFCVLCTTVEAAQRKVTKRTSARKPVKNPKVYKVGEKRNFSSSEITAPYKHCSYHYNPTKRMYSSRVGFRHNSGKKLYVSSWHPTVEDCVWFMKHMREKYSRTGKISNVYGVITRVVNDCIEVEVRIISENI